MWTKWWFYVGSFGAESGVDECIEHVAESINYAHSRVEKVVTGISNMLVFCILMMLMLTVHTRQCPDYLSSSVQACSSDPARIRLRSVTSINYSVPRTRTKFGDRAFSVSGPVVWNSIPAAVRDADTVSSFKRKLKTHFFLCASTMFDFDFWLLLSTPHPGSSRERHYNCHLLLLLLRRRRLLLLLLLLLLNGENVHIWKILFAGICDQ